MVHVDEDYDNEIDRELRKKLLQRIRLVYPQTSISKSESRAIQIMKATTRTTTKYKLI